MFIWLATVYPVSVDVDVDLEVLPVDGDAQGVPGANQLQLDVCVKGRNNSFE